MTSIFISYRRQDASGHAGRLSDRLVARFGAEHVFMDVEDIQPGQNFARSIEQTLAQCSHVIAVVGPRWIESLQARSAAGEDFVRHEIAVALTRGLTVIPVLVAGARMPAPSDLPAELSAFGRCQAVEIRDDRFDDDATRLTGFLAGGSARETISVGGVSPRALAWGLAAVFAVAALAGGVWWTMSGPQPEVRPGPQAQLGADISGEWIAEMQKPGQPVYRIRLALARSGDRVIGSVRYPTGEGTIADGRVDQHRLTFQTSHVPQFASEPAVVRFQGEVDGEAIRLVSSDDNGMATGVARRAPRALPSL